MIRKFAMKTKNLLSSQDANSGVEKATDPRHCLQVTQRGEVVHVAMTLADTVSPSAVWLRYATDQWMRLDAPLVRDTPTGGDGTATYSVQLDLGSVLRQLVEDARRHPAEPSASSPEAGEENPILESADGNEDADEQDNAEEPDDRRATAPFGGATDPVRTLGTDIAGGLWTGRTTLYVEAASAFGQKPPGALVSSITEHLPTPDEHVNYKFPLGRFPETELGVMQRVESGETSATVYPNKNGALGVCINMRLPDYQQIVVSRLRMAGGKAHLRGHINARHTNIRDARFVLTGRYHGLHAVAPAKLEPETGYPRTHFGHNRYRFDVVFDFRTLINQDLPLDEIADAWMEVLSEGNEDWHRSRIGRTPFVARQLSNSGGIRGEKTSLFITPYYTVKAKRTSFYLEAFATEAYDYLRKRLANPAATYVGRPNKPVWLIGERPTKAQDTGLHFFRYMRAQHPEIDAHYVIDPASPEIRNLQGLDNVVAYRSVEHIRLAFQAERFVGSHHPDFLFPTHSRHFAEAVRARKVFLQHGVIAMKWMVPNYGKQSPSFDTDLFLVSSEREKEFIVQDFGYSPNDVVVTGLSRFDTLFSGDVSVKSHQVLIIPTWRDWLHTDEQFLASAYYRAWSDFFHDPRLREIVETHGLDLVFCLHPNMQHFRHHFAGIPARIIVQGEVDVQHLLKESAAMITDYSSVAFDFSFLDKPVLFYQFDRGRMFRRTRPHMDIEQELPGPAARDLPSLLDLLGAAAEAGLAIAEPYRARAGRFIKYRDNRNSERIFEAILKQSRPALPGQGRLQKEVRATGFRVFRKSRLYHPVMRRLYKALSLLPADPNLIVFESGLGKQLSDSPRAIYNELVRRGDPRRKVWSYNGRIRLDDANTSITKRLTPAYFWSLGRAKFVVSNQNLPFYITRGPGRVFVQTWHGTPLKKMLHDLDEIHGRDAGYVGRVSTAVRQWSVLVSPSPYTTAALRSAYHYEGPALEVGYPRNDILLSPVSAQLASDVRERLGIPANKRVVLYAPTFRDDQSVGKGRFSFELPFSLEGFHAEFGTDTVLLLRLHVLVDNQIRIPEVLRDCIINASGYPEIQELYLASDVLVTDYSSVFFDFSLLRRPMVFFAYDLETYRDSLRGFYLDYESSVPGPVVTTEESFFDALRACEKPDDAWADRIAAFSRRFNPHDDGHAAERVVDAIFDPDSETTSN